MNLHAGSSWKHAIVKIPEGTVALRLLASLETEEDVVKLDSVWASSSVPNVENITCAFETDLCGWSTAGVQMKGSRDAPDWRVHRSSDAFQGDGYLRFDDESDTAERYEAIPK